MMYEVDRCVRPSKQRRLAGHYLHSSTRAATRLHRTAALAARAVGFPFGHVNIIDDRFLYTLGNADTGSITTPRAETMCQFVIDQRSDFLAVDDLRADERFANLPAVLRGNALSYLGVPLRGREASTIGTLCVVDDQPHRITDAAIERLMEFGEIVEDQLDLIRRTDETAASREASSKVARALEAGEIEPWYQPIVDLTSGRRVGFEALARWRRPDGSVVSPDEFVSAAEDSDLVIDLDRAVVRAALRDLARWRRTDPSLHVNINLSTRHLELDDGATFMVEAVQEAGVDPAAVGVEITESRALTDLSQAASAVWTLQSAGFRVILDDFANGWSGLDWLLGLDPDGLKVDRVVTAALGTKAGDAVSRAVVGLAGEMGMATTIEGIGDPVRLDAARRLGFQTGQGYLWSPPVPAAAVDASE